LYLPYKQKRRTKAQIAREAGIEPLALALLADPALTPEDEAEKFSTPTPALPTPRPYSTAPARSSWKSSPKTPNCSAQLRDYLSEHGRLRSTVVEGKENEGRQVPRLVRL
jgi:uncharacterized protein